MSTLFSSSACAAVLAGLGLAFAAPPAHGQASGACTVEIQMAGETLATGLIGPESMGTPLDRRARGAVGGLSWSWGMSSCTPDQLRNVSADGVWVPVGDVAAALGDGGGLRVDRGQLTVSHRPVADREPQLAFRGDVLALRDPGTRTLDKSSPKLAFDGIDGESAVISSNLRWFAAAEDEEEVQTLVMPLSDLGGALGSESGGLSYTDFGLFGSGRPAVDLKSGPDCTLCAVDYYLK